MVEEWKLVFEPASKLNAPYLNRSFGLLKERTFSSPTLSEQIELTIQVLHALVPLVADHDLHPRPEKSHEVDWASVNPARLQYNSDYERSLRDKAVGRVTNCTDK